MLAEAVESIHAAAGVDLAPDVFVEGQVGELRLPLREVGLLHGADPVVLDRDRVGELLLLRPRHQLVARAIPK